MVALDCSEPLLKMDEPSNQELKKSKKKKKNKHKDSESPKDDSIKIAKAYAMNEMNSHVENLSKKKKHKKSKCTEESSIESNEKDKNMQTDQDVEPTKKHKKKKKEKRQKDKIVTEILVSIHSGPVIKKRDKHHCTAAALPHSCQPQQPSRRPSKTFGWLVGNISFSSSISNAT